MDHPYCKRFVRMAGTCPGLSSLDQNGTKEANMSVARTTEISASGSSLDNAVQNGVDRATKTLKNVEQVWVKDIKARVANGSVSEYRVDMKVTFVLDD